MHASGLQDFQMGRIFHPDKLENPVGIRAMHAGMPLLDCTEPFTACTPWREYLVKRSRSRDLKEKSGSSQRQIKLV
jgi:hypothetical protein